ncbi:MAG: HDOD domain-containing protein [Planctomycetes bacterium]|nr:HDOD domain-containing protein [Planctomycetota bacterium]
MGGSATRMFPDAFKPDQADQSQGKVPHQQIDLLIRQIDSLPSCPDSIARMLNAISAQSEKKEILSAAATDPAITARLLCLARSRKPEVEIQTLEDCLEILPNDAIRSAILSMQVVDDSHQIASGFDYCGFRAHCVATACAAEMLAERSGRIENPSFCYICGLLHDIGKIALSNALPKTYRRVLQAAASERKSLIFCEREIIGIDHTIVGRRLGRNWSIPVEIQEVIWLHHQPVGGVPGSKHIINMVLLVQLADIIARQKEIGFSGNSIFTQDVNAISSELGLSSKAVDEVSQSLPEKVERLLEIADTSDLSNQTTTKTISYGLTLAKTGEELAKLNETLIKRANVLERYDHTFEGLGHFVERISPSSSLHQICQEISYVFASASDFEPTATEPICTFALINHSHIVLSACSGFDTEDQEIFRLGEFRNVPSANLLSTSFLHPAGEIIRSMEFLSDVWSDLLDIDNYLCIPLLCQGRFVGGVLLPNRMRKTISEDKVFKTLAGIIGFILAALGDRAHADALAEQLAQASQHLEEVQQALTLTRALAEVGQMAAGAGHEINNPLAVISGRAQLLANRAKTKKDKETAELIAKKAQEISDIISELMSFAQPAVASPRSISPAELLTKAKERFLSELESKPPSFQVDITIEPNCPPVWVDVNQIEEVMVELLRNAYTASEGCANVTLHAGRADSILQSSSRDSTVLIQVHDDGPGMDEETLKSAFTPFFSRREAGRGRGMGLTRAKRIIESNGGKIRIESKVGEGTTVFVELPQAQQGQKE